MEKEQNKRTEDQVVNIDKAHFFFICVSGGLVSSVP
jgi:hypothetical protein